MRRSEGCTAVKELAPDQGGFEAPRVALRKLSVRSSGSDRGTLLHNLPCCKGACACSWCWSPVLTHASWLLTVQVRRSKRQAGVDVEEEIVMDLDMHEGGRAQDQGEGWIGAGGRVRVAGAIAGLPAQNKGVARQDTLPSKTAF